MNQLFPEDIEWKFDFRYKTVAESHSKHRDNRFGIQKEVITKRISETHWGSSKTYYFIDGVENEFTDLETLCEYWNEHNNYDDAMKSKPLLLTKDQYAEQLTREWYECNSKKISYEK